ncbi:LysR family transcriptional regulator [Limnohabitans radicicola]|uniref:LysR family transcriptional regulator n=1 Tax=Limnohabitans radicicola TaxID=2771427 RepID=A0A927FFR7_9BURK|nr:LysR family transcriptional regulator [Limnohabitans radicicola]MBD8049833.1 LysR family transcriptional regulator [Limnohabitans radicicola]
MELARLDLNLLLVFHHLLREKRVSAVATVLGMSQPAVSSALGRLRSSLGDELFLRTQRGMAPTPYALQLAEPVAAALDGLQQALNVRASFAPTTSERRFTLAMTDVGEMYFLPVLMGALAQSAPGVTLNVVAVTSVSLKDDMASGRTDLALGLLPQLQAGFFQQALFRQPYVCLMREGHPLATAAALSLNDFAAASHVRVIAAGTGHGQVDEALERQGLQRRIRLTVPHYVALGDVLGHSDLIATVPERFAQRVTAPFALTTRPLPLTMDGSAIHQFWHARLHKDPGHQWLRELVAQCFGDSTD